MQVEEGYYHNHTFQATVKYNPWLQFTASPPSVADLNNDGTYFIIVHVGRLVAELILLSFPSSGQKEVIAVPNVELDPSGSGDYITQYYAVIVLNGVTDASKSATRFPGWNVFPKGQKPINVNGYYPPSAPPAPVIGACLFLGIKPYVVLSSHEWKTVDIIGDDNLEIITTLNDGAMYCFDYTSKLLWRYNYKNGLSIMYRYAG